MKLEFFNSLNRTQEVFEPLSPPRVTIYSCGPTVYKDVHIGNLRSFIFADILRRSLEYSGYRVKQVINITDVGHLTDDGDNGDDKLELEAKDKNQTAQEIAQFYTRSFFNDLDQINVNTDQITFPKASDHITEQIKIIEQLEKKGFTYRAADGIYFNTAKVSNYDAFNIIGDLRAGARIEINSEKLNLADFALWKFSSPKENRQQEWPSPWGVGFPGWHIECSAMAMTHLGQTIDIHTGGVDLKFPHHTNEIAQSECSTGQTFARWWLHSEFVNIKGKKMAKSDHNFTTLKTLIEKGYSPLAYRYWALTGHYRSQMSFSWEALGGAQVALDKLRQHLLDLKKEPEQSSSPDPRYLEQFENHLADDLDSPKIIALIWNLIKDKGIKRADKASTIEHFDRVLGLNLTEKIDLDIPPTVIELVQSREKARADKDWAQADKIRQQVENQGFDIKDTDQGPEIKPRSVSEN